MWPKGMMVQDAFAEAELAFAGAFECPKCGSTELKHPRYERWYEDDGSTSEELVYVCERCRYGVHRPCKDAGRELTPEAIKARDCDMTGRVGQGFECAMPCRFYPVAQTEEA